MKQLYPTGATKTYVKVVQQEDTAAFESGEVHPVYATFALARDAEWAGRLFVLDMRDADEEGIGTFVHIDHQSPAMIGDSVVITATLEEVLKNAVNCTIEARVGDRLIAAGRTGQKIIKKERLEQYFRSLSNG